MSEPDRRELLERLDKDLSQIKPADEEKQQLLEETRAHIQRALDEDDDESLAERLQDTVYEFEGTHPDLANTIMVVIDTLSNMGI